MYARIHAAAGLVAAICFAGLAVAQTTGGAFLGIYGEDPQAAALRRGSYVREVIVGGPGARGGLRPGDVIIRADNREIATFDDLVAVIKAAKPGDVVNFGVQRGESVVNVAVTLGSSTDDASRSPGGQTTSSSRRPMIGILSQPLDEGLRTRLNVGEQRGVLVAETEPEGPAAKAGVESGDVVLSVDDQPTSHPTIFSDVILTKKPGDVVTLKIWRAGKELEKKVTLAGAPAGVTGRTLEGPLGVIRSHQVEEMRLRIKELEAQVKDLTEKLERATASGRAPAPPKPELKAYPKPDVKTPNKPATPGVLPPVEKPRPTEEKKAG